MSDHQIFNLQTFVVLVENKENVNGNEQQYEPLF